MTSSNENIFRLLALCAENSAVTSEFPSQRPVMRSFDDFFYRHLNKPLSKQSRHRWFEMPSRSLWRHWYAYWEYLIFFVNERRAGRLSSLLKKSLPNTRGNVWFQAYRPPFVPRARTELGSGRCLILGVKLWNHYFDKINTCFRTRVTKSFIAKYTLWCIMKWIMYVYIYNLRTETQLHR